MDSFTKLPRWLLGGLILFPLFVLNSWLALKVLDYFQPFITISVLATLLAFILNYPVQFLQKRGLKRNYAVVLICLLGLVVLFAIGITIVPLILEEFSELVKLLPQWIDSASQQLQLFDTWINHQNLPVNFNHLISQLKERLPNEVQSLIKQIFNLALGTIDSISDVVLVIVLTFYLLLDGGRIWQGIFERFPSSLASQVQQSLQQNFQKYFTGQITLASLIAVSMTLEFLVLKVRFGLLFGLGIGIMSLIPFGDVLGFTLVSLLVASHDLGQGLKVLVVTVIIDQIIDNGIAPRLIGGFTGLSPLIVLASLFLGTKIAGLLGLLIAVPVASFIKSTIDGFPDAKANSTSNIMLSAKTEQPAISPEDS